MSYNTLENNQQDTVSESVIKKPPIIKKRSANMSEFASEKEESEFFNIQIDLARKEREKSY